MSIKTCFSNTLKSIILFFLFFAFLFLGTANAHHVWLESDSQQSSSTETNRYWVKFGHVQSESYPQDKLKNVQVFDISANPLAFSQQYQAEQQEVLLKLPQASAVVLLDFDNGIWSKLPNGQYAEKSKRETPSAVSSVNSIKIGKIILQWSPTALQPFDSAYELVPQAQAQTGKPLNIRVLQNGLPVAGVNVGFANRTLSLTSDQNGMVSITPKAGENKILAEFQQDVKGNPDYDTRSVEYLLSFKAG